VLIPIITHFWVIPQIHLFSSKKIKIIFKLKIKKKIPKNNSSEKRMPERPENG
jgi:hypothetical protein